MNGADDALLVLRNLAGDEATVSLHGAQLLSWVPRGAGEQLYLSPLTPPAAGKSARGGVPVCFPQFSGRGPLPKHGFVRTSRWELVSGAAPAAPVAEARLQVDSAMAAGGWEHAFCLVLVVRLGPGWIELHLQAANTGRSAWEFTAALHTYLAVPDVLAAHVRGLQGCAFEDNAQGMRAGREESETVTFASEVDRVYLQVPPALRLEAGGAPVRRVVQQGFADAVVWNPGPVRGAALPDLPAGDWQRMVCIEAAAVGRPVLLAPGKTWQGLQRLELPDVAGFDLAQATMSAGA